MFVEIEGCSGVLEILSNKRFIALQITHSSMDRETRAAQLNHVANLIFTRKSMRFLRFTEDRGCVYLIVKSELGYDPITVAKAFTNLDIVEVTPRE